MWASLSYLLQSLEKKGRLVSLAIPAVRCFHQREEATGKERLASAQSHSFSELHPHLKRKACVKRKKFCLKPFQLKLFFFILLLNYS